MDISADIEASMNTLQALRANPQDHYFDIIDAMLSYGVEAPVDDDGEIDDDSYLTLIAQAADDLIESMEGDHLRIFRAMVVPHDWHPENLGVYWARRRGKAFAYNANLVEGIEIILEGLVHVDQIRLHSSIVLNMDLTEEEVLVRDDAAIEIVGVWTKDGSPTHQHIVGRSFHAEYEPATKFLP
jgi:hypothetical protein